MRWLVLLFIAPLYAQTVQAQTGVDVGAQAKLNGTPVNLAVFLTGTGAPAAALCPTPPSPTGRLYVDTSPSGQLWFCKGSTWVIVPLSVAPPLLSHTDTFEPPATPAALSAAPVVAKSPIASPDVQVYVNGLLVDSPGDYTLSGQSVTFTGPTGQLLGATVKLHYLSTQ